MFTGINFDVTTPGRYYCEVTEQRGVYRSNSFTVYKIGKCVSAKIIAICVCVCVCVHARVCECVCV